MAGYLLDTNIVSRLRDGQIDPQAMRGLANFVTHVQLNELEQTPDTQRRQEFLKLIRNIEEISTSSMVIRCV
jgi:predicted nucleic acid-binding protein